MASTNIAAQDYSALEIPEKYVRPKEDLDYKPSSSVTKGRAWVVFSDRTNNKTYNDTGNSSQKTTLGFLDELYPVEEKGEYLHVVKGKLKGGSLKITVSTDCGWIHKKNLLLWSSSLVNINEITKKSMLLNTPEGLREKSVIINGAEEIRFYADPTLSSLTDKYSRLFHIFFIYKQEGNSLLIGINDRHDPNYINDNIMGWVSVNKVTMWDHRVAVEPNWDEEAAHERQKNKVKTAVFDSKGSAESFKEGSSVSSSHIFWDSDSYADRKIGEWRRFPVLNEGTDIWEVGVMGQVINNNKQIAPEQIAKVQNEYNKKRDKLRNINVVFVVEGTNTMQDHYPAIGSAISKFGVKAKDSKNNFRFGAVVYRDQKAGGQLVEIQRLSNDRNATAAFFNKLSANFTDNDENALNYGLKNAIRNTGISAEETNILIVVGISGSHDRNDASFVGSDEIVNLMYDNNCHLLAFQIRSGPEYDNFVYQVEELIKQSALQNYNYLKEQHAERWKNQIKRPKLETDGSNKYILKNTARMGGIIFTGGKMTPDYLETELYKALDGIGERTDKLLNSLDYLVMGYGSKDVNPSNEYVDDFSQSIFDFLGGKRGFEKSELSMISENNRQFYINGFTVPTREGLEHSLYKNVLFLTRAELGQVVTSFEALSNAGSSSDRREKMQKTWLEILQKYTGGKRSDYENMTMEEINRQVFGLPGGESSLLKDIKLREITDKSRITDIEFEEYADAVQTKYRQLFKAYNQDNYPYSFRSNDVTYYWVAEDMLP